MIWRPKYHRRVLEISDFLTAIFAYVLSYYLWIWLFDMKVYKIPPPLKLTAIHYYQTIIYSFLIVYLFAKNNAYGYQRFTSLKTEYIISSKVITIITIISILVAFGYGEKTLPRTIIILPFIIMHLSFILQKTILFKIAIFIRRSSNNRKRILLVGTGKIAEQFIKTINESKQWGLEIIGIISSDKTLNGKEYLGYNIIENDDNIEKIIKEYNPEEVIITSTKDDVERVNNIYEICKEVGIQVRLNSDFFGNIFKNITLDNIYGLNIITLYQNNYSEFELFIKGIMDFTLSLIAIILLSPLFLIISFLIWRQNGKPILYDWKVVGKDRKPLSSWKFRTMVKDADIKKKELICDNEMQGPVFKIKNDPRILPVGRFLRKYSLDELPQLFSVLKGDMSLVGPRPPLLYEFEEFNLWHRRKSSVKPGITCLWQISGRNKINNFDEWARLDLEYIDNWSIWLDIKILLKTIPVVLTGKGAS